MFFFCWWKRFLKCAEIWVGYTKKYCNFTIDTPNGIKNATNLKCIIDKFWDMIDWCFCCCCFIRIWFHSYTYNEWGHYKMHIFLYCNKNKNPNINFCTLKKVYAKGSAVFENFRSFLLSWKNEPAEYTCWCIWANEYINKYITFRYSMASPSVYTFLRGFT